MRDNLLVSALRFIIVDLIGEILYFPIWWYTRGTKKSFLFFWRLLWAWEMRLSVRIWIFNLFKPMYGLRDWGSKIISFFMRLIQIAIRSIILGVWGALMLSLFLLWLFLPLIAIFELIINLS